ncbi:MAG: hypothetical protein J1F23_08770 [Oscillospiraceae bacterium]|nr:hypothetical protein [Oscillospiraceae bacterium]
MYKEQAIQKIDKELKEFKGGDQKANAVKKAVADKLKMFSGQDDEFAQAIVQSDKTLADCCSQIMKGVGNSIEDIEVYKRAVKFYFSTADIQVKMTIDLCAGNGSADKPSKIIELSFDDLF